MIDEDREQRKEIEEFSNGLKDKEEII